MGGASGIPFLSFDGETPNPPVVAMDVLDKQPSEWPKALTEVYGDVWSDPTTWAKRVKELGADFLRDTLTSERPALLLPEPQPGREF